MKQTERMVSAGGSMVCAADGPVVCIESLLGEMLDRDSTARLPEPAFTCSQSSSYDRSKTAPDQPGWFGNNDHGQYIRDEENQGRRERVMMDAGGPGCIVRFWLTTDRNKKGTLRIYMDVDTAPVLTFPAYDLLSGDLKVDAPLAQPHPGYHADQGGATRCICRSPTPGTARSPGRKPTRVLATTTSTTAVIRRGHQCRPLPARIWNRPDR